MEPRDFWKTLKQLIKNNNTNTRIPILKKNDVFYVSNNEKANCLNNFFQSQTILNDSKITLPATTIGTHAPTLADLVISPDEVTSTLCKLKTGKASGPDNINNRVLKELSVELATPLSSLFNYSWIIGKVPDQWKLANVCAIHKKNDPQEISNYRPISLLSTISKVMEKIIHKHVFNFFSENNMISALQSGFVPKDSTVNQLTSIYHAFCQALDEGKEVRAVFCDISKAFDRVWHRGLLYKLENNGISGNLLTWFSDYLTGRKQRVALSGTFSNTLPIMAGVPQGSILGPLLFIVFINDIVDSIHSAIRLFADDTSLYIIIDNPISAAEQLNSDLIKINDWANTWLVTFNPNKTETLLISRKINKPIHPPLYMNDVPIEEVHSHKHLGITFSDDGTWHEHIDRIKEKVWKRGNIM